MKVFRKYVPLVLAAALFTACSDDDNDMMPTDPLATCEDGIMNGDETGVDCGGSACSPCSMSLDVPATYVFERDGNTSINFSGQTTRILMAEELIAKMLDNTTTAEQLLNMFAHEEGRADFENADLNASDKNIRGKTAASFDLFSGNSTDQAQIRVDLENWIQTQVNEVFPAWNDVASPGVAGQIADGSSTRYVTAQGLEMNQLVNKSLVGALMADQILNNYVSEAFLDANREANDNGTLVDGENYTDMEHDWDEAYGYAFGTASDLADPRPTIGEDDSFLNKYIGRVEGDPDFEGITEDIFLAYRTGRAAIVGLDYDTRDEQAAQLRDLISQVIAIRAVFYLQQTKNAIEQTPIDFGAAFHDFSEGYGFIYSLQFTRRSDMATPTPYFTRTEVLAFIDQLLSDGPNGIWDVRPETLDMVSEAIATRFDFTVEEAGSTN